jgi:hypothetical protein
VGKVRLARHVACMGYMISLYRIIVSKFERKRQLGAPRHIQRDNIKMFLK